MQPHGRTVFGPVDQETHASAWEARTGATNPRPTSPPPAVHRGGRGSRPLHEALPRTSGAEPAVSHRSSGNRRCRSVVAGPPRIARRIWSRATGHPWSKRPRAAQVPPPWRAQARDGDSPLAETVTTKVGAGPIPIGLHPAGRPPPRPWKPADGPEPVPVLTHRGPGSGPRRTRNEAARGMSPPMFSSFYGPCAAGNAPGEDPTRGDSSPRGRSPRSAAPCAAPDRRIRVLRIRSEPEAGTSADRLPSRALRRSNGKHDPQAPPRGTVSRRRTARMEKAPRVADPLGMPRQQRSGAALRAASGKSPRLECAPSRALRCTRREPRDGPTRERTTRISVPHRSPRSAPRWRLRTAPPARAGLPHLGAQPARTDG